MPERAYEGEPLDLREQYITERPELDEDVVLEGEDELVYATEPEEPGEERTEGVPLPPTPEPIDEDGQTSIVDWNWGAKP